MRVRATGTPIDSLPHREVPAAAAVPTMTLTQLLDKTLAEIQPKPPRSKRRAGAAPGPKRGRGRPALDQAIELLAPENGTHVRPGSLRGRILAHLRAAGGPVRLSALEDALGRSVKGAVQKLVMVGWVRRNLD